MFIFENKYEDDICKGILLYQNDKGELNYSDLSVILSLKDKNCYSIIMAVQSTLQNANLA